MMSANVSNSINSTQILDDLKEQVQQGDPKACFEWVVHCEQQTHATTEQEAQARVNLLVQASNENFAPASLLLGQWYFTGRYVQQDIDSAILFFQHAAQLNHPLAITELAFIGLKKLSEKISEDQGLSYLKQAAELNVPDAIHHYGISLVKRDLIKAEELLWNNYEKNGYLNSLKYLIESNHFDQTHIQEKLFSYAHQDSFASAFLGFSFFKSGDEKNAFKYANSAQEQNDPYGCYVRALIEQNSENANPEIVHEFLVKAARYGHVDAAYLAAVETIRRADELKDGAEQQELRQQAFQLMHQAAVEGHAPAQYSLAQCYRFGVGVEKNIEQGVVWLEKATLQNNSDAQFELAMLLPIEHLQHRQLLNAAAENGHTQAMLCMAVMEQRQQNLSGTLEWLNKAQELDVARASYLLADIYKHGKDTEVNLKQSFELYKQAAELGDVDAYFELFKAYKDGLGIRKNKKMANKYLNLAKDHQHIEAASITA